MGSNLKRPAPAKVHESATDNEVDHQNDRLLAAELDVAGRLQHVATQLISSQDTDELHGLILETTLAILHADIGSIQRFFPERGSNGELKLLSHRGFSSEAAKRWEWVNSASRTTCGEALRSGGRVAIADIGNSDFMAGSEDLDGYLGEGIRAAHTMPLISRSGALLGMVSAYWREARELSMTDLRSLDILARMAADAIERSRAEETLRESEERFRSMADTAPVMIWVSGPDMLPTFFNQEWLAFTGRTMEEELAGGWAEGVHPVDLHRVLAICASSVEARRAFQMEYRFRRADGEYRWVLCRGNPRISADGGWVGYIGSVVDVTDVRRAQSEAFDKQRIESLRVLTNGIAHDFNNLLGTILAQADLAAGELADGSSPEEQIRTIAAITVRASEIVRQLMIYAGQDNSDFGPLDLSMLIEEMLGLLKASLSKHAVLKSALATDLPPVRGNAAQIRQVVMNLIINASEAIGERDGLIHVATSLARGGGTLSEGDYVRLEISDTGCGITDEQRSRIFDPFFSTKSKGHGLGLAVVEGIVRAHTGGIHLSSTPGRGSTFQILLPCIGSVQDLPSPTPDSIPNTNSAPATLLLVEDEEGLRYSISKILSGRGYSVLTADNGSAAMDILRAHSGTIDAILLDMSIPGASSHEIIKEAELRRPEVKVVITSAYSRDVATSLLSSPIVKGFIRKPYQSVDLLQILQSTLNSE